jgi:hypothetical protein
MKTNYIRIPNQFLITAIMLLAMLQVGYSQKNTQTIKINTERKILTKVMNPNCDCKNIEFKVRIFKLNISGSKTVYRLQLIDFENKNKCTIQFSNFNWKNYANVPFSQMRKVNEEQLPDGSLSLYEFDFESKVKSPTLEDESLITTSFVINVNGKKCLIENTRTKYFNQM